GRLPRCARAAAPRSMLRARCVEDGVSESVSETLGAWGVPDPLVRGLEGLPFVELTETQRVVVPRALTGRDLLVQAPTGTGKTLAFGLPLLRRVRLDRRSTQGLVVCPTRE